jgi:hypothetical protein
MTDVRKDVEALRKAADDYGAFVSAGCPVDDPYDIYPPEVWQSLTTPACIRPILAALAESEQRIKQLQQRWQHAVEHARDYTEADATRFKLSLRKNGTATNVFPKELDQRWVAFVAAEDDAHVARAYLHREAEQRAEAAEALLRELLAAEEASFPPEAAGIEAQRAWASRSRAARDAARDHLSKEASRT